MLFSTCHALSAVLGLIMLSSPAVLADFDWAVTTFSPVDQLCSGEDCVEEYEESPCSLFPEECIRAEEKRASGFSSWGGKRTPFSTWGGKRSPAFNPPKRVPFSTWGGKRGPVNAAANKKGGNFNSWGGKRVAFSSWGGKRTPFSTWGGKRTPFSTWGGKRALGLGSDEQGVFSAWGGKREDPSRDKRAAAAGKSNPLRPKIGVKGPSIRRGSVDFYPWGGKREIATLQ